WAVALLMAGGLLLLQGPGGAAQRASVADGKGGEPPGLGRCHMETCSWTRIRSERLVAQRGKYRLIEVTLIGGASLHPGGRYPDRYAPGIDIEWRAEPHRLHVLCAAEMPSVIQ